VARASLDEAGGGDAVTILPGDAPETLAGVRGPANGYVSVRLPVEDEMEISTWTGDRYR
jgi:hypothetical protein